MYTGNVTISRKKYNFCAILPFFLLYRKFLEIFYTTKAVKKSFTASTNHFILNFMLSFLLFFPDFLSIVLLLPVPSVRHIYHILHTNDLLFPETVSR